MEGNYKQIQTIRDSSQDKAYKYYLDKFDSAIRFQIARSAERSYESLKINDAVSLLLLQSPQELNNFINQDAEDLETREIEWKVIGDRLYFNHVLFILIVLD
jgi:26S proteasome regulatory subunit N12